MIENGTQKKIIAIIGLMGAGKTTVGTKLANKIGAYFVDSDQEIEDLEQKSISEIFITKGEKYFREAEKKVIKEIIDRDEEMVLSLGGGAFIDETTRDCLKQKAIIIWLDTDINVILKRIGKKKNRPLLSNGNKREILEELSRKRIPIYKQADLHIDSSHNSQDCLIDKIINEINKIKDINE
jgi:shikimate kinase